MAIIQCPECKKEISDTAPSCPGCGYAFKTKPAEVIVKKKGIGCGGAILVVFIFAFIVYIISSSVNKVNKVDLTPEEKAKIEAAEKLKADLVKKFGEKGSVGMVHYYLSGIMKDPDSLELDCGTTDYNSKSGWVIKCDWRGKNSFGGYQRKINWFVIRNGAVVKMESATAYD